MTPLKILILEDNGDRQRVMRDCLEDRFAQYSICFFATAVEMLWYLQSHLEESLMISLDHDLELVPGADNRVFEPGTGRDIADYLASQPAVCPVVIHSTNSRAADGMEQILRDAGWQTSRVTPYGDLEWIPEVWFRTIRDAIVAAIGTPVSAARP